MSLRSAVRRVAPARQRRVELASFSAPIAGLISNRALADPNTGPQGAVVLQNFFPTPTGIILRRGTDNYAQMPAATPVPALFSYSVGGNERFFAATETTIYDITNVVSSINVLIGQDDWTIGESGWEIGAQSVENLEVWEGATGGDWHVVQFTSSGGTYLIGVNGASQGFIFDGERFYPNVAGGIWALAYDAESAPFTIGETVTGGTSAATGVIIEIIPGDAGGGTLLLIDVDGDFEDDETVTDEEGGSATVEGTQEARIPGVDFDGDLDTSDMAYVWTYMSSLWFAQKDSLSAWYLDVDQIGGQATEYPLGAMFNKGGSLLVGQSWSLPHGGSGGLSEQCAFVSTKGEVVVYAGINPALAESWGRVGTYQIGVPLGRRAFVRAGGDLVFATTIGKVPLSTAIQVDTAALAPRAVSYPIEDDWNEAVTQRGADNWISLLWPDSQMMAIAAPFGNFEPLLFAANVRTGAWCTFTNWPVVSMGLFQGRMYFGTPDGFVVQAMVGGTDRGAPYTGIYMPLFSSEGSPTVYKTARMARFEAMSNAEFEGKISCRFDFDDNLPAAPNAGVVSAGSEWNVGIWNEAVWNSERDVLITKRRASVSGHGYRMAPVFQVTSAFIIPLDVRVISVDVTYEMGDIFT